MIQWLQVTSGRGPAECCWVVARVVESLLREAKDQGLKTDALEFVPGDRPNTLKSALLALEGDDVSAFVEQWEGTIQWIGRSLFRPHHKRKNWFVGVTALKPPEIHEYSAKDFRFDTMKSSGPGGQHVNKTESAVRVTHIPTGISAIAREERSQHLNRKLALSRIGELLKLKESGALQESVQEMWSQHNALERGNPIRTYESKNFRRKA